MKKGDFIAVWLHDSAAREFLGLNKAKKPSRWVMLAQIEDPEGAVGPWLSIEYIEERRPSHGASKEKRIRYTVTPKICLIRYDFIVTAQLMGEKVTEIGFHQES